MAATRSSTHAVEDVSILQNGDHIYVHASKWGFFGAYRHGIVAFSPQTWERNMYSTNQFLEDTLVFEITSKSGPHMVSLKEFKQDNIIRKAYYNATSSEMALHPRETCCAEHTLAEPDILQNTQTVIDYFGRDKANRENLANKSYSIIVCCMTGKVNEQDENSVAFANALLRKQKKTPIPFESSINNKDILYEIKKGDHICCPSKGYHAIVCSTVDNAYDEKKDIDNSNNFDDFNRATVLANRILNETMVFDMNNSQNILKHQNSELFCIDRITLKQFLKQDSKCVRIVKYSATSFETRTWKSGTCYIEQCLSVDEIMDNVKKLNEKYGNRVLNIQSAQAARLCMTSKGK